MKEFKKTCKTIQVCFEIEIPHTNDIDRNTKLHFDIILTRLSNPPPLRPLSPLSPGLLGDRVGVRPAEQPPPAGARRLHRLRPRPAGPQPVRLHRGGAARQGEGTPPPHPPQPPGSPHPHVTGCSRHGSIMGHGHTTESLVLSWRSQRVTFLMPGFYGWMCGSYGGASPLGLAPVGDGPPGPSSGEPLPLPHYPTAVSALSPKPLVFLALP